MMAEFVVTDPDGKEFVVNAPEGATQDQALEFAKTQFGSTSSGAAVGNPNLMAQGARSVKPDQPSQLQDLGDIAGAGAAGGALGAFSSELLRGGGRVLGSLPYPAARTVGGSMEAAGDVLKVGGRVAPTVAGTISGLASETSGKAAEALGAGPVTAEVARLAGGGLTAETANAATEVLRKYALTPALGLLSKFKHETAKVILEKLEGASVPLTQKEADFVNQLVGEIRGPAGKTDVPLERVGSIMGDQGKRLLGQSDQMMMDAMQKASGVGSPGGMPGTQVPLADVGGALRDTITKRNEAALAARREQYAANEKMRDSIVAQRERSGNFISDTPEYEALIKELKTNLVPGARSPSVQAGYQKMIDELGVPSELTLPTMKGGVSFQAIDDVRRKLGDAFRGKPSEGYDAIGEAASKDLYGKVSELQKKFAGPAQTRLLDEYAAQTKGLEMFSSKTGKKATALDQYRDEQFATDPSLLPASFFKTRASIQALKELTGNPMQVNAAALHYADKELEGKTASEVRAWMGKNNEWLSETKPTLALVDKYATRLEGAERSMKNAQDFAKQAAKDSSMLTRQSLPAQRAVDLIRSGDTELWNAVAPAIAKSPQAKKQMVDAVRQVVADTATAESTSNLFARNIRPFLEKSNIASKQEMDFIAKKLSDIQTLNIPERERLGMTRRLLLNSTAGWAASAASRTGFRSMAWAVPQ